MEKQSEVIQEESNQIYDLAKKITEENLTEDKREELLNDLSELFDKSFIEDSGVVIEMATQIAYKKKEVEVFSTMMDEIELSIEYMEYKNDDGKYYSSSLFLLPFIISSEKPKGVLPSIQRFEDKIREKLVEFNIVKDPTFFRLAASRFDHNSAKNMELVDWWNIHNDSIQEDTENPDVKSVRNEDLNLDLRENNIIIYLVAKFDWDVDAQEPDISCLLESGSEVLMAVGESLSTDDVEISMFSLNSVQSALQESSIMLEQVSFTNFFNKQEKEDPDLEIAYAQMEDDSNDFCVMFIDSESKTLSNYYRYETEGEDVIFVKMLIEKVMTTQMRTLWKLEKELTHDVLEHWSKSKFNNDIAKYLKTATQIDVDAIYASYYGAYSKPDKPTLH